VKSQKCPDVKQNLKLKIQLKEKRKEEGVVVEPPTPHQKKKVLLTIGS
jgi:hypothetical protein